MLNKKIFLLFFNKQKHAEDVYFRHNISSFCHVEVYICRKNTIFNILQIHSNTNRYNLFSEINKTKHLLFKKYMYLCDRFNK